MRITYRRRFVVGVLASLLSGLLASTASAAVPLGGGASIVVGEGYCTLTTVGHDNTGELVGFTAAHCGGLGARVRAKPSDGSVVAANGDLDYANNGRVVRKHIAWRLAARCLLHLAGNRAFQLDQSGRRSGNRIYRLLPHSRNHLLLRRRRGRPKRQHFAMVRGRAGCHPGAAHSAGLPGGHADLDQTNRVDLGGRTQRPAGRQL